MAQAIKEWENMVECVLDERIHVYMSIPRISFIDACNAGIRYLT